MSDTDLWVAHHLRNETSLLVVGTGALMLASFVNFRSGATLRNTIQEVSSGEGRSSATRGLIFFGVGAVAGCIRTWIIDTVSERLRCSIATQVFAAQLLREPSEDVLQVKEKHKTDDSEDAEQIVESSSPTTAAVLEADVALVADAIPKLQNVVRYSCSVIGGSYAMFRASWKLSAAVWPLLVTGALKGARASTKVAGKDANKLAEARAEASGFAHDRLVHVDLVRWFSRAACETDGFRERNEACLKLVSKSSRGRGIAHLVMDFAAKAILLGLSHLGSQLVQRGELTAGELTAFFWHATFMGLGIFGLVGLAPEVATARCAARRLQVAAAPVLAIEGAVPPTFIPPPSGAVRLPLSVECKDISFAYPGGHNVLEGVSLSIPAGSTCALVGASGCGKTTLVRLLMRDFDSYSGVITFSGKDVKDQSRIALRADLSIVPQTSALLGASVGEAIAFGVVPGATATDAAVESASRQACAHDFVAARQGAYSSSVGSGGAALSGGERQRVAIARAIIRHPRLLILDEPTSALDSATAASVGQALLQKREDRPTTIVVTHRLELIRSCDMVAVLSAGKIVQQGQFSDLLAQPEGALAKTIQSGILEDDSTM